MRINTIKQYAAILVVAVLAVNIAQAQINTSVQSVSDPLTPTFPWRAGSLAVASFDNVSGDAALPGVYVAGIAFLFPSGQQWVSTGMGPVALVAADLDGDGNVDVAVVEQDSGTVSILTNNGLGTFTRTASYATGDPSRPLYPTCIAAADINGDGKLDLVVVNRGAQTVVVLRNTGTGFAMSQTVAVTGEPNALVIGDFDKDGWPDVAVACATDDTVEVLHNNHGLLTIAGTFDAGPCPEAVAAADLNNDGTLDLAVADREAPQVTILLNDGTGQFTSQAVSLSDPTVRFETPVDLLLVDMDNDGLVDIRCAGLTLEDLGGANFAATGSGTLSGAVYGQSPPPYQPLAYLGLAYTTSAGANAVSVASRYIWPLPGDVNGDMHVDVVDLLSLVSAFGAFAGDLGFNPACDFNNDGTIDVVDLLDLVYNFGK